MELVRLSRFLDEAEFGARLVVPSPEDTERVALARELRFGIAVASEMPDPTPYISAGDLLMTYGEHFSEHAEDIDRYADRYVERLREAGLVGLVIGLEPVLSALPEALIAACERYEMPLIELPPEVYFAPILRFVSRELESERVRSLASLVSAAQHLTEATIQSHPAQRLVSVLARESGAWAILHTSGETVTAGTHPGGIDVTEVTTLIGERLTPQLRQAGMPTAFATVETGETVYEVAAHAVLAQTKQDRSVGQPPWVMLVKTPRITGVDRTVLQLTANLLGVIDQMPFEQTTAVDQLLMDFLINASRGPANSRDRARIIGLLRAALGGDTRIAHAVVAERVGPDATRPVGINDASWFRRLLRTPLVENRGRKVRAFVAEPPRPADLAAAEQAGWVVATSREKQLDQLPQAMAEAEEFMRTASRIGAHVSGHEPGELETLWPFAAITDPSLGAAAAHLILEPLEGDDVAEVREALAAWLRQHGSWDRTARTLGLHRNSVRRLVTLAAERLRIDLDDPVARARVLLAFTVIEPEDE